MSKKKNGVTMKVADDFYKLVQRSRLQLKLKHGIKIKSDVEFTNYLSKKPAMFSNKSFIKSVKRFRL